MKNEKFFKSWKSHEGEIEASSNGFDVINCKVCGFKHIIPIPTIEELEDTYRHDYYNQEKPLYLERYQEDLDWWNMVYTRRYEILENFLPVNRRSLLDIGSGPGYFLLNGQKRGWVVKGMEPSVRAMEYARTLGLDIDCNFYSERTAAELGSFDAVNISLVLEHIPDPYHFMKLIRGQLRGDGVVTVVVPNDFNPLQLVLRDDLGYSPWWVAPPHHINYFNFESLAHLLDKSGFEILHQESTFPIDIFLLMGDNYIADDEVGRACHIRRMNFEKAILMSSNKDFLTKMYNLFSSENLGREVVMYARIKK